MDVESTLDLSARAESEQSEGLELPITLNGRYELTELLGKGGMGVVYRATDLVSGRAVALKTLGGAKPSETALALFKAEFMTLSTLSHPNIAAVYDFARRHDFAEYFFTMELVFGQGALAATQGATVDQISGLILQVLRALAYLHARGVIHFDLKPANIMVAQDGRVRLLDFGVARSTYSRADRLYSTPIYTAPEVRGEGAEVDRRADLYSLGVTWFQLLLRRLPALPAGLEKRSDSADFELSSEERAALPAWLPPILLRLVERNPARRFRSASEVIAALNQGRGAEDAIETHETSDSYIASAALVGRDHALEALFGHVQRRVRLGRHGPLVAFLVGPSGSGKSRLLRQLRHQCQLARYGVFEGHCYAESGESYAAFHDVVGQAASALSHPAGEHLAVVARLAPEVAARWGPLPQPGGMDVDALAQGLVALLLAAGAPAVVTFSDLQWMDSMSLDLLERVLECCAGMQREVPVPLAFVLSARAEFSGALAAALERWRSAQELLLVELPPLDAAQVGELVASMLGATDFDTDLARALTDATRGDALLVAEVLRAWARDGRLVPEAAGWSFRVSAGASEISEQVERLWRERLAELAVHEREVLCALAVFGRPIGLDLLSAALALDLPDVLEGVAELRRRQLVFLSRDELVQVASPRFRDAASALLEPSQRMALHLGLGNGLALAGEAALAAFHFESGANQQAAAEQHGRAAAQCFERGALNQVLEHTERAEACGASGESLGRLCSLAAEAARLCADRRAVQFARRALTLLPAGSGEWLQASRVAIATFNPFATDS